MEILSYVAHRGHQRAAKPLKASSGPAASPPEPSLTALHRKRLRGLQSSVNRTSQEALNSIFVKDFTAPDHLNAAHSAGSVTAARLTFTSEPFTPNHPLSSTLISFLPIGS